MGKGRVNSVVRTCEKCGQAFHPWKSTKPSKYCSRACAPRGRQPTLSDAKCEHCGVLFRPTTRQYRFCTRPCYLASNPRCHLKSGYVAVYAPTNPAAWPSGQIFEHRLVMEEMLGRYLWPFENVHHINGKKDDNRPENLELWVVKQPSGQRVPDLVAWAKEILELYE